MPYLRQLTPDTMRHRTHDERQIAPSEPPGETGAVWHRDGRCADVLAELLGLPAP